MVSNSVGAPGELPCNSTDPARSSSDPNRVGVSDETGNVLTDHLAYLIHHRNFLQRLQAFCLHYGEIKPTSTIVSPMLNGLTGVTNGVEIPFIAYNRFHKLPCRSFCSGLPISVS